MSTSTAPRSTTTTNKNNEDVYDDEDDDNNKHANENKGLGLSFLIVAVGLKLSGRHSVWRQPWHKLHKCQNDAIARMKNTQ